MWSGTLTNRSVRYCRIAALQRALPRPPIGLCAPVFQRHMRKNAQQLQVHPAFHNLLRTPAHNADPLNTKLGRVHAHLQAYISR